MDPKTYRHIPRVLANYFKLLCQVNGCSYAYKVEEDSDPHTPGELSGDYYMITVVSTQSDRIMQRVAHEAYGA